MLCIYINPFPTLYEWLNLLSVKRIMNMWRPCLGASEGQRTNHKSGSWELIAGHRAQLQAEARLPTEPSQWPTKEFWHQLSSKKKKIDTHTYIYNLEPVGVAQPWRGCLAISMLWLTSLSSAVKQRKKGKVLSPCVWKHGKLSILLALEALWVITQTSF